MALWVYTQTGSFKPSCPPPHWLFHSPRFSPSIPSSRSFWVATGKALRRQEVYKLQSANRPTTSCARLLPYCICHTTANGRLLSKGFVHQPRLGKGKQQFLRNLSISGNLYTAYEPTTLSDIDKISKMATWADRTEELKELKRTYRSGIKNTIEEPKAMAKTFDGGIENNKEAKLAGLVDGYTFVNVDHCTDSFSLGTDKFARALCDSFCQRSSPQIARPPHNLYDQDQACFTDNQGKACPVLSNGLTLENLPERKQLNGATDTNQCSILDEKSATFATQRTAVAQPDHRRRLSYIYDKVLVVDSISIAKEIVGMLTNQYRHLVHACDTEVAQINVKEETPVDHGELICFSIYSGPGTNYGNGKSCIWVDVLDGGGRDLLVEFAPFFEDPSIKKVWHNYSFDNHIIENYGLKLAGFHADTMHMARLWDSSRKMDGGYSLEALSGDPRIMSTDVSCDDEGLIGKVSMKAIFGKSKVRKDGSGGKVITVAPVEELQREEDRKSWICYSAQDSMSTLKLYESLKSKLSKRKWELDGEPSGSMFDFYEKYWRPFGEILVKMETEGMLVDRAYLAEVEKLAKSEQQVSASTFRNWAASYCSDAKFMNVGSDTQLRLLFFGGTVNRKDSSKSLPEMKEFKVPNTEKVIEEGKTTPTKYRTIKLHNIVGEMQTEMYTTTGWPCVSAEALKTLAGSVSAQFDFMDDANHLQTDNNVGNLDGKLSGKGSETMGVGSDEDMDTSAYGTAYAAFGGGEKGRKACLAIASLCEICSIDSLISNFILPLQGSCISGKNGRIHCSLNINTETGRLSARRPNLQNQPALEKDRYKIRRAFVAAPGNSLIVADYGQLELRILAHLANCKSMLDAFKAGGDFHSRTAMNMYPHIREAVEKKQVLLEWHPQPGQDKPPVPLLKDAFASERRKAKMLNFSIAYGKTPVGLARDWKVSVREAKETVDRWYRERKEVLRWQKERKEDVRIKNCVHTLLGRARSFPSITHASTSQKAHIERAAINTPVQGSAADVTMCAMLEISENTCLRELGWRLILQVHDEVILEGPAESAEVAKAIVVECMSKPFSGRNILKVDLSVDAKCAQDWYSAK